MTDMKVELVDHMGTDLTVVNAARVSMDKESGWDLDFKKDSRMLCNKDTNLIKYLAKHNHWTPFGHCFVSFRIKAPIFVARQLGKHQVGLVWNEVSRRYVDSEPEFYYPSEWRGKADNVKQGSSHEIIKHCVPIYAYMAEAKECYEGLLAEGVCPEQARMVLPQSMLTEWIWSGSLMAFSRVCKLRLDPHTQKETQHVAQLISNEMGPLYPVSWKELQANE